MSAFPTITEQVEVIARTIVPYVLIFLFLILDMTSLSFIHGHLTQLPFLLTALFYWAVYRPVLLPLWLVFVMGLLIDIASAGPLGLHGALFCGIFWFIATQRLSLIVQSYGLIWFLFGTVLFGFYGVRWLIMCMLNWTIFPFVPSLYEIMGGFFAFPFLTVFLHLSHRILPPIQRQMTMNL